MTRLILIRHGETDWNTTGRWQGQSDVPLNTRGREQARRLAAELAGMPINAIYSSDLSRARDTAMPLAQVAGQTVIADEGLRDRHHGQWQGMLAAEIKARFGEAFRSHCQDPLNEAPPGGESAVQVQARLSRSLGKILQNHPDGTVVVVSHRLILGLLLSTLLDEPLDMVWERIPENGRWQVVEVDK